MAEHLTSKDRPLSMLSNAEFDAALCALGPIGELAVTYLRNAERARDIAYEQAMRNGEALAEVKRALSAACNVLVAAGYLEAAATYRAALKEQS